MLGVELPIRDPQMALKELNRVAGKPGVNAVHLPDSIERHDYIINPNFAPVLKRIEELGYPIIFHQMDGVANNNYGADRAFRPAQSCGQAIDAPTDHTVLATKLMMSGILDQYSRNWKWSCRTPVAHSLISLEGIRAFLFAFSRSARHAGAAIPGILAALLLRLLDLLSGGIPVSGQHGGNRSYRSGHGYFCRAGR